VEEEPITHNFFRKVRLPLLILIPLTVFLLRGEHYIILSLMVGIPVVGFGGYVLMDWLKHRKDNKGLSIR
jgi:hypothetical protein